MVNSKVGNLGNRVSGCLRVGIVFTGCREDFFRVSPSQSIDSNGPWSMDLGTLSLESPKSRPFSLYEDVRSESHDDDGDEVRNEDDTGGGTPCHSGTRGRELVPRDM